MQRKDLDVFLIAGVSIRKAVISDSRVVIGGKETRGAQEAEARIEVKEDEEVKDVKEEGQAEHERLPLRAAASPNFVF